MSSDGGETTSPRPNFVLQLVKDLTELESSTSGVRQVVEVAIAAKFLAVVLGTDWAIRKLTPQAKHDEWMQNRLKPEGMSGIVWGHRVVRLANAFHTLLQAHVKGFDILQQRFHKRPTKPCFIETEIASLLTVNGFTVEIIGESGVRGRDFDLSAHRDEIALSIEVTGKEGMRLTANTIKNTLTGKRTQIPATAPAILYMHVPANWMQNIPEAQGIFNQAFNDFFKRSHRFNAVFLVWEEVVPFSGGGNAQMTLWPCYNNHPRHAFSRWDLLNLPNDSNGRPMHAYSFYDWLKGIQAKYRDKN